MIDVIMPQMGESLAEGTIVKWLKAPGDSVARDESIVEISTDKVDTDVPSPAAGVLQEILAQPGDTVAVGAVVARIAPAGVVAAAVPSPAPEVPPSPEDTVAPMDDRESDAAAASAATAPAPPVDSGGHFKNTHAPQLVSFGRGARAGGKRPAAEPAPAPAPRRAVRQPQPAAPAGAPAVWTAAVLETARQGGLTLDELVGMDGSGRNGRVTKRDVLAYLDQPRSLAAPVGRGPAPVPGSGEVDPPAEYLYRPGPDDRRVQMSPVRRRIAQHMTWSARISPHATAFAEVDMTAATRIVAAAKAAGGDVPVTITAVVARAAILAMTGFEVLNSSVIGDEVVMKPSVHLGVAVALPDTNDLIVPVVRRAEELSLSGLARAINDLAVRARSRSLAPQDVQGGTFTLTNPGIFGGLTGTPILNQPQVAILGLGAIVKRPVVIDDTIAIRPIMTIGLTFDHRALDGMVAFRYLAALRAELEGTGGALAREGRVQPAR